MSEQHLSRACLSHLGFTRQPFERRPPVERLYTDERLDERYQEVLSDLRGGVQRVALLGERDAGKTTEIRRLAHSGDAELTFCRVTAGEDTSLAAIECAVHQAWPLPEQSGEVRGSLGGHLSELLESGPRPVLMVDDADQLEASVLGELVAIQRKTRRHDGRSVALVLTAESDAEVALSQAMSGAEYKTVDILRLSREQAAAYIRHRLEVADASPDLVQRLNLDWLYELSGGLAGRIDRQTRVQLRRLCQEAGIRERRWPPKVRSRGRAVAVAAVVLVAAGLVPVIMSLGSGPEQATDGGQQQASRPLPVQDMAQPDIGSQPAKSDSESQSESQLAAANEIGVPERPPKTQEQGESSASDAVAPEQPERRQASETPAATAAESEPEEPAAGSASPGLREPAWLLQQPGNAYTVQVLGTTDEDALRRVAEDLDVDRELAYFKGRLGDQPWYVLVAGIYGSSGEASDAIAAFPEALRANDPYVRPLDQIQSQIRAARP